MRAAEFGVALECRAYGARIIFPSILKCSCHSDAFGLELHPILRLTYRVICFEWPAAAKGPSNVEIVDYH